MIDLEGAINIIQAQCNVAAHAAALTIPKEARGDLAGAKAELDAAKLALDFALAGIAAAKAALNERR